MHHSIRFNGIQKVKPPEKLEVPEQKDEYKILEMTDRSQNTSNNLITDRSVTRNYEDLKLRPMTQSVSQRATKNLEVNDKLTAAEKRKRMKRPNTVAVNMLA
jgi:hypothetical protein